MFRPRHAYRSPITNRYRGKAKGCPVFNNLNEITSEMVEQHDECLECLAKLKNRTELYKTLADNNKPSNNVIKSLQRLSSSASNNRLKTCLQFLIIKVNEKSITNPTASTTTLTNGCKDHHQTDATEDASNNIIDSEQIAGTISVTQTTTSTTTTSTRHSTKRLKSYHNIQNGQLQLQKQKLNQLASPPQDQVSSTQDQIVAPAHDDHDCQTSPPMLTTTHIDEQLSVNIDNHDHKSSSDDETSPTIKSEGQQTEYVSAQTATTTTTITPTTTATKTKTDQLSSPPNTCNALSTSTATTTTSTTTSTSSSPRQVFDTYDHGSSKPATIISDITYRGSTNKNNNHIQKTIPTSMTMASTTTETAIKFNNNDRRHSPPVKKRRRTHNSLSSDQETSSVASWSLASYGPTSPPSPTSSTTSRSSSMSSASSSDSLSSFCSSSSCSTSPRHSPSPSPLSSPDIINELRGPRLKLSEEKIRKIKKRPVLFDDLYYFSEQPSVASTPTTSSGCSPGQHSTATQSSGSSNSYISNGSLGIALTNPVIHMFQAPPAFVNNLKPCNLPLKSREPPPRSATPAAPKVEMITCAICGIRDKPPNILKIYGQNSCSLCTEFFSKFLERPVQLYCAQDGDCLMTFDSRCRACWIKICLQKFDIDEDHRKVSENYSPKLLSSPNVSLITIDTSVTT